MSDFTSTHHGPGRPLGKAVVTREQGLCLHDISLMRAVAQGVDARAAADRYLPEVHADERVIQSYLRRISREAAQLVADMGDVSASEALLKRCDPKPVAQVQEVMPSLEQFAEEEEIEDFSEAEIIALYQERFAEQVKPGVRAVASQQELNLALRGLATVQSKGMTLPQPLDPVLRWFSEGLSNQLRGQGVFLLHDLVQAINTQGKHWYKRFPGVGKDRARRLVGWLVEHEEYLQASVIPRCRWIKPNLAPVATIAGQQPATGPSGQAMAKVDGFSLRADGPNAMAAGSDTEAITSWLEAMSFKSDNTRTAYARDVHRLMLWAREQGKTLSGLTVSDAAAHARFLGNPPAHWMSALPTRRDTLDWKPMRGPLSASSAARALTAIGHLFSFLVETGYLVANPFSHIRKVRPSGPLIDTRRSLTTREVQHLVHVIQSLPEDATKRRLVALLMLLESTGLRIGEVARTWGDLVGAQGAQLGEEDDSQTRCLRVVGKGERERFIPLRQAVIDALEAHRQDRQALVQIGLISDLPQAAEPLISVLEKPVLAVLASPSGALSAAGLHRVVKAVFKQAADASIEASMRETFERATCHWLRHTFAHSVLKASGKDLPVTQQLLGHGSISTTGIYIKADMTDRVRAINAMPDPFERKVPMD